MAKAGITRRLREAALRCKGQKFRIVASAHTPDEYTDDPPWVEFVLTNGLIDKILAGTKLCREHSLECAAWRNHGAVFADPNLPWDELQTDLEELVVYKNGFVLKACVKNGDVSYGSAWLYTALRGAQGGPRTFFKDVLAGRRFFAEDGNDKGLQAEYEAVHAPAHA
ncbi:MAG TPA: hypothetical protein VFQ88_03045 [Nevskiaceae bacterium]|nr:hypothetical protein [Nevskiaceae bacterium]